MFHKYELDPWSRRVDDGQPHRVTIELGNGVVSMMLDDSERIEMLSHQVDLTGARVYLGGIDHTLHDRLPWHVWSRLGPLYRGCLWSVRFNSVRIVDLPGLVRDADLPDDIQVGCTAISNDCTADICHNDGFCSQSWTGPVCDCSSTAFTGTHCEQGLLLT